MRAALLSLAFIFFFNFSKAQDKIQLKGDLKGAPLISINQNYSFKKSPAGYGKLKEFKINPAGGNAIFKEERNSAWFAIEIPFSGILTFDLSPHQIRDDYDWMLFKYTTDLEKSIRNGTATPVRSNNARNATSLSSKTGMGGKSQSNTVKPGPGDNYSASLKVKSGERFALIVDNIYGGKGFDLVVGLKPDFGVPFVTLKGYVKDRNTKRSIPAEVIVDDDSTGVFVGNAKANSITGHYEIQVPLNRPLNITASHPDYIFATSDTIITRNSELNFLLDTPFSGSKLILTNIHFYPNKDEILPSSIPELERLLDFMKTRPDWQVKITGHTNPNVFASARYLQQLSFNRAIAVKKYLLKNSITEKRISCSGVGGNAPVVITKDPLEGLKNLRVEVTLIRK